MKKALSRAIPAGIFVGFVLLRRDAFVQAFESLGSASTSVETFRYSLLLSYLVLGAFFYLVVAALFIRRHDSITMARGIGPTALAFAGAWGAAPLALLPITQDGIAATVLGNGLMVIGIAASCYVLMVLGRHFGIRAGARGVVARGPYSRVRHPLYVAEAVIQLGLLVVVISPAAIGIFALYLALQYRRAVLEERVLSAAFPSYREYQARTSRFIPGLI